MFKELIDTVEELEGALLLLQGTATEEAESQASQTLQEVASSIFKALHSLPASEVDARPSVGFFVKAYVDPKGELFLRGRWEIDSAIVRCVEAPRGGLLVVGIPGQPSARIRALVEDRIRRRVGDHAVLHASARETTEGNAFVVLLGHVAGHRAPDAVDGEASPGRLDELLRDEDVERYIYQGSPPNLSAKDTLWQYGLAVFNEGRRTYLPTLAGMIAFAGRPWLQGLAFEIKTSAERRSFGGLALRELCERAIRYIMRIDERLDPETLRQMLVAAVVHRSWRPEDQRRPIRVEVGARAVTVRFPGAYRAGWTRNELLLHLVRRNRALGWDAPGGDTSPFRVTGTGDETVYTLERSPAPVQARTSAHRAPQPAPPPATAAPPRPPVPGVPTVRAAETTKEDNTEVDLGAFIDEVLVVDEGATLDNPVLWEAFTAWCGRTGTAEVSQRWLSLRLKARGFAQAPGRTDGVRRWQGFRLRD